MCDVVLTTEKQVTSRVENEFELRGLKAEFCKNQININHDISKVFKTILRESERAKKVVRKSGVGGGGVKKINK
jgi:hypothetical protein